MFPGIGTAVNVVDGPGRSHHRSAAGEPVAGADARRRDRLAGPGDAADRGHLRGGGARLRPVRRGRLQRPDADRARLAPARWDRSARCCASSSAWSLFGGWLQTRLAGDAGSVERHRFIEGFVTASLLFCTGPLTILGSLNDGLGNGADQLFLKAVLDGFAAIAFAASFGWGVAASALTVIVVQGSLTVVGFLLGDVLPAPHLAALTATGGLLLVGVALRLLRMREIPVADLLPALAVAPLLVQFAAWIH